MNNLRNFGLITGILSSVICLIAGIWLVSETGFRDHDDILYLCIGIYFIGKAFFVGPMLIISSLKK